MQMRQLKVTQSITNRESASLEKYLQEVARIPMLQDQEEEILAKRIKKGDRNAKDRLVAANLRFVISVAKQFQNQGLSLSDLINEGNIGLIKAAERFDASKGFKFISFAVWWIRQSILLALVTQSRMVRLPQNRVELNSKIGHAISQLEQEFERAPEAIEIAQLLNVDAEEVEASLCGSGKHISVDAPVCEGEDSSIVDNMMDVNAPIANHHLDHLESLKTEVSRCLNDLTQRQKEVLCFFYGINQDAALSLEDIGNHFKITRERVRQIKEKAISRLQNTRQSQLLRCYLGV